MELNKNPHQQIDANGYLLYCGDCLDIFPYLLHSGIRVNLTITSPPYDNLRLYENTLAWTFEIFCKIADFLFQITLPGGCVVWIVNDAYINGSKSLSSFQQALYFKKIGFNIHDVMIWNKECISTPGNLKLRYAQVFEFMFILSKGKPLTFHPIKDRPNKWAGHLYHGTKRLPSGKTVPVKAHNLIPPLGQRYNIWNISPHRQWGPNVHPAPFPEKLVHDHIISWSNPGDIILDPLMGGGTTGKVAILNQRKFIGIEKVPEYFRLAKAKISPLISFHSNI